MPIKFRATTIEQLWLFGLASWLTFSILGCDTARKWLDDRSNLGTVRGLQECIQRNSDLGISEVIVKHKCLSLHEEKITADLDAAIGYHCSGKMCPFYGIVLNKSYNFVVTGFKISISHVDNKDPKGNLIKETASSCNDLWIEPKAMDENVNFCGLKFSPGEERLMDGDNVLYSWKTIETRGLRIELN